MPVKTDVSDQTKKIIIGVAAAAAVAGVGFAVYKTFSSTDLEKDLEKIKALGNLQFKDKNYEGAIKEFTKGIERAGPNTKNPIVAMLYQNRAACREKIGQKGHEILNDCLAALKVDKKYAKAYLRAARALSDVGKKKDALAYLLAAFILDSNLNRANFDFFETLLTLDPLFQLNDCHIGKPLNIEEVKPRPVALFRIQQWCDTWDVLDLFKTDFTRFEPDVLNEDQKNYKIALDKFKNGKYEEILESLTEENRYPPAMILRGKMLSYSIDPNDGTKYVDLYGAKIEELIGVEENEDRRKLMRDAFDILKIELMYKISDVDKFLQSFPLDDKSRLFKLYSFAAVFVFNGCVLDTGVSTHEEQMMADTSNTNRLLEEAAKNGALTPHLQMVSVFLKLCTCNEFGDVHNRIREMEELAEKHPSHFNLVLLAKVYMMANNEQSSESLLNEAAKIQTRYLVPSRLLQSVELHVHKPKDEYLRLTTETANAAIALDPYNFSAHVLHLLRTNEPEPMIKKQNYEQSMESIRKAAVFAPPRELLMLKRMIPLLNAKKRAAEMLDMY